MQTRMITFEFIDSVPPNREDGKLYISTKYRTAIHSCLCGCGLKVVTPLRPGKWTLTYDGDTISLWPSIGNWSFPCRSHYIIKGNEVVPAGDMADAAISAGRRRDEAVANAYYRAAAPAADPAPSAPTSSDQQVRKRGLFAWFFNLFRC